MQTRMATMAESASSVNSEEPESSSTDDAWRMPSHSEFMALLQGPLAECIKACEKDRRRTVRNGLLTIGGILALGVVLGMTVDFGTGSPFFQLTLLIVTPVLAAIGYTIVTSGFRSRFKAGVISPLVRFFGKDFQYSPDRFVPQGRFRESKIFNGGIDRYRGEDLIQGTAGRTRFECSEVHAEFKEMSRDSKGRRTTRWHTIFRGLYFIADFNKAFSGTTLVLPDTAQALFGWLGQKLQEWNTARPGSLVKLEDPDFETLFVVYSTDQITARYILSPSLMGRLVDFRRRLGRSIYFSFIDGAVHIAVDPGRNLFEPKLFSRLDSEKCVRTFEDMRIVLEIVEELDLNTRIWSKR